MAHTTQRCLLAALGVLALGTLQAQQRIEVIIPGIPETEVLTVDGIGTDIQVGEEVQPDGSILKVPEAVDPGQLVLTRYWEGSSSFIDWMNLTLQDTPQPAQAEGIVHRDIAVRQRIGAGTGLHVFYLDAFPVKYDGPDFGPETVAMESLTCVFDYLLTLLAPDPFKVTRVEVRAKSIIVEWEGVIGDGQFQFASSPRAPEEEWMPVVDVAIEQNERTGSAVIPLEQFTGNLFFFRIDKP